MVRHRDGRCDGAKLGPTGGQGFEKLTRADQNSSGGTHSKIRKKKLTMGNTISKL